MLNNSKSALADLANAGRSPKSALAALANAARSPKLALADLGANAEVRA